MQRRASFENKAVPFFCDLVRQKEKNCNDTKLQHEFSFPSASGCPGSRGTSTHETKWTDGTSQLTNEKEQGSQIKRERFASSVTQERTYWDRSST